ncbi:hypothetical protein F2Q68_00041815 [Brassica cretica]|uniref:Uncharacterized protein n=1 Tax=Brassica cretica TaxID=69181 RepID=A0A8S9MB28_BRACR|nr:hypothetical protein F2Q68_00041815 [Brassica cretica]
MKIPCQCSEFLQELLRGVGQHFDTFKIKGHAQWNPRGYNGYSDYVIGEIVFFLLPCNWFPPPSTRPIQTFLLCPLLSSSHEAATTSVHAVMTLAGSLTGKKRVDESESLTIEGIRETAKAMSDSFSL